MNLNFLFSRASSPLATLVEWPLRKVVVCVLAATLCVATFAQQQEQPPPQTPPPAPAPAPAPPAEDTTYEFVSGIVTELSYYKIVVNRALQGKPPENRSFIMNDDTKVEGNLKENARVTVGFKSTEEGEVAVRIIVRAATPPKKN